MIEYYNLKNESRNSFQNNKYLITLSSLIENAHSVDHNECMEILKKEIIESNNPIELLKSIPYDIRQ